MQIQKCILIALGGIVGLLVLVAFVGFLKFGPMNREDTFPQERIPVGGDPDEHGCIGSAGYSWCEEKGKCLRVWEEPCEALGAEGPMDARIDPATKAIGE